MRYFTLWMCWLAGVCLVSGCVEAYEPTEITEPRNLLVVDGFINGNDSTRIQLSRSQKLSTKGAFPAESKARVFIEAENGARYPLTEVKPGRYVSPAQTLPTQHNYRLRIRTSQGREYASDYTSLKVTPAIDNLEGRIEPNGLQLYLSTKDESGQTQYYRWRYEETWEFFASYESLYEYDPATGLSKPRREGIYQCWRTDISTAIKTTSTVRLSQDAVRDYRLLFIPSRSPKFRSKYSILVRQYALSQAEFDYWEAVKKNTENIGTLFDPLPSQIQGNVHCLTDAEEPVLGFVGATTQATKRIFIGRLDVPLEWSFINEGYEQCTEPFEPNAMYSGQELYEMGYILISRGTYQTKECGDCRIYGTNVKPSYWP